MLETEIGEIKTRRFVDCRKARDLPLVPGKHGRTAGAARLSLRGVLYAKQGSEAGIHCEAVQMKTRIVEAQAKMRTLHDDYLAAKKTFVEKHMRRMRRAEFKIAKIEFKAAYTQWRTFRKAVRRAGAA